MTLQVESFASLGAAIAAATASGEPLAGTALLSDSIEQEVGEGDNLVLDGLSIDRTAAASLFLRPATVATLSLAGTVTPGDMTIPVTGDLSQVKVGDEIYINSKIVFVSTSRPMVERNKVAAINGQIVTLAWPIAWYFKADRALTYDLAGQGGAQHYRLNWHPASGVVATVGGSEVTGGVTFSGSRSEAELLAEGAADGYTLNGLPASGLLVLTTSPIEVEFRRSGTLALRNCRVRSSSGVTTLPLIRTDVAGTAVTDFKAVEPNPALDSSGWPNGNIDGSRFLTLSGVEQSVVRAETDGGLYAIASGGRHHSFSDVVSRNAWSGIEAFGSVDLTIDGQRAVNCVAAHGAHGGIRHTARNVRGDRVAWFGFRASEVTLEDLVIHGPDHAPMLGFASSGNLPWIGQTQEPNLDEPLDAPASWENAAISGRVVVSDVRDVQMAPGAGQTGTLDINTADQVVIRNVRAPDTVVNLEQGLNIFEWFCRAVDIVGLSCRQLNVRGIKGGTAQYLYAESIRATTNAGQDTGLAFSEFHINGEAGNFTDGVLTDSSNAVYPRSFTRGAFSDGITKRFSAHPDTWATLTDVIGP